jgi:hypothetical protein
LCNKSKKSVFYGDFVVKEGLIASANALAACLTQARKNNVEKKALLKLKFFFLLLLFDLPLG